jgi:hypothetical protein
MISHCLKKVVSGKVFLMHPVVAERFAIFLCYVIRVVALDKSNTRINISVRSKE